ncbi:hypothetical protein BHE74_00022413, partial [Ensete ventricosum]
ALLPSGGTSRAGDAASHGRCPCWRLLLPAVALVGYSLGRGATPCDLAVGSCHLRPGHGRLPLAGCPQLLQSDLATLAQREGGE